MRRSLKAQRSHRKVVSMFLSSWKMRPSFICAIMFVCLYTTTSVSLDLRPTVSPFIQSGTDVSLRIQGNVCVGTGTPVDALSLCTSPVASATRALVNLSNTALSGGSASGTYLGANPAACSGNFIHLQVANANRLILTCAGLLGVGTAVPGYEVTVANSIKIFSTTTSALILGKDATTGTTYGRLDYNDTTGDLILSNPRSFPVKIATDDIVRMTVAPTTGNVTLTGKLFSTATADLGWTIQNAANQACNTTCTTGACVVGLDTAALGNFLACTDVTADTCLCAG